MKTSLEIPDELYREIKVKAAREGRKISDVIADGLRLILQPPVSAQPKPQVRLKFPLLPLDPDRPIYSQEDIDRALNEEEDRRLAALIRR